MLWAFWRQMVPGKIKTPTKRMQRTEWHHCHRLLPSGCNRVGLLVGFCREGGRGRLGLIASNKWSQSVSSLETSLAWLRLWISLAWDIYLSTAWHPSTNMAATQFPFIPEAQRPLRLAGASPINERCPQCQLTRSTDRAAVTRVFLWSWSRYGCLAHGPWLLPSPWLSLVFISSPSRSFLCCPWPSLHPSSCSVFISFPSPFSLTPPPLSWANFHSLFLYLYVFLIFVSLFLLSFLCISSFNSY